MFAAQQKLNSAKNQQHEAEVKIEQVKRALESSQATLERRKNMQKKMNESGFKITKDGIVITKDDMQLNTNDSEKPAIIIDAVLTLACLTGISTQKANIKDTQELKHNLIEAGSKYVKLCKTLKEAGYGIPTSEDLKTMFTAIEKANIEAKRMGLLENTGRNTDYFKVFEVLVIQQIAEKEKTKGQESKPFNVLSQQICEKFLDVGKINDENIITRHNKRVEFLSSKKDEGIEVSTNQVKLSVVDAKPSEVANDVQTSSKEGVSVTLPATHVPTERKFVDIFKDSQMKNDVAVGMKL